jgi:hypothetical protein
MLFLFCSFKDCRRSRDSKREQDAVPDNGTGLERREAPGPTLLGPRARKRQPLVTGDLPWRAPNPDGFGTRGDPRVAPPGAPFPFGETEKRERRAGPGARIQSQGSRNLGWSGVLARGVFGPSADRETQAPTFRFERIRSGDSSRPPPLRRARRTPGPVRA